LKIKPKIDEGETKKIKGPCIKDTSIKGWGKNAKEEIIHAFSLKVSSGGSGVERNQPAGRHKTGQKKEKKRKEGDEA